MKSSYLLHIWLQTRDVTGCDEYIASFSHEIRQTINISV